MTDTQPISDAFPHELQVALQRAWEKHRADVDRFGLKYKPGGTIMDGIYVLVFADNLSADARSLVRAFREIESDVVLEALKEGLDRDITLTLAPPTRSAA